MSQPTPIRSSASGQPLPALTDIVGRLRWLADEVESGRWNNGDPLRTLLYVIYHESGEVDLGAFGDAPKNKAQVVGILELAKFAFTPDEGDISRGGNPFGEPAPVQPIR